MIYFNMTHSVIQSIQYSQNYNQIMRRISKTPQAKIVVIGDMGVGKSSITLRYVYDKFSVTQESTLGATYLQKTQKYIENNEQKQVKFQIWDTAGQQKYRAIAKLYYRDCKVAILVYDVCRKQTLTDLQKWSEQLIKNAPKNIQLFVVANKIDLLDESSFIMDGKQVSDTQDKSMVINFTTEEQGIQFAKQIGAGYFAVSARSGKGINQLFNNVAQKIGPRAQESKERQKSMIQQKIKVKKQAKASNKQKCCK